MTQDNDDLQALFDNAASTSEFNPLAETVQERAEHLADAIVAFTTPQDSSSSELYQSIGLLVRRLHDALQQLGQDHAIFHATAVLPESRERLTFIGDLMESSATQCVKLTEQEMPRLDESNEQLVYLKDEWNRVISGQTNLADFKRLALMTPDSLQKVIDDHKKVKQSLMDILMAQGFQDLAGQTLNKVILQAKNIERELLQLLAMAATDNVQNQDRISEFLEGPQFKASDEAVHSQADVDDLLTSLGF